MKNVIKVVIILFSSIQVFGQVPDTLKTIVLENDTIQTIQQNSVNTTNGADSTASKLNNEETAIKNKTTLLKKKKDAANQELNKTQSDLDNVKKQQEEAALKVKAQEEANRQLIEQEALNDKLQEKEAQIKLKEQEALNTKKQLDETQRKLKEQEALNAKMQEQEARRMHDEQVALTKKVQQEEAQSKSNDQENKKTDKLVEKEASKQKKIYRDSIVSTFVSVPSAAKSNENLTADDLKNKTNQFFKKQDAISSALNIEGYLFQGIAVYLEGSEKSVRKAWKEYLKETNNIKIRARKAKSLINKKKTPYYKAAEVNLSNVTDKIGDVLTVIQKENGYIKMTVVYKLGYNTSVNQENFPGAFNRLKEYVQQFSQVNFQEHYDNNIKGLKRSVKNVSKEVKKEEKVLRKQQKSYKRFLKKNDSDKFKELSIEVQSKLIGSLKAERNNYEIMIMEYKSRNSQIRLNQINQR